MTTPLETLVTLIGQELTSRHLTIATAESCTGGGLSYWITQVPGSSHWFERGFVTYSNQAKIDMLGVNPTTLDQFGAVSEETVREMAIGALNHSQASISIAITGIAGPDGGSPEKPVGTVWIAWAARQSFVQTHLGHYTGDRVTIRTEVIQTALQKLLDLMDI
jgi:nicotinamide-nucleotide amidase